MNSRLTHMTLKSFKELEIHTSNLRLVAKCWGNPEGLPVLALHGWLDNAATFDHLAPLLPEFQLVSLDLPGHGFSDHRPSGMSYHFTDMVVDVLEVANVLNWDFFSLLGHSMGAGIASYLGGTIPEKIKCLMLIEGLGSIVQAPEEMPENLREATNQWLHRTEKIMPVYPNMESAVKVRHNIGSIAVSSVRTLVARGLQPVDGGFTWRSDPNLKLRSRHYFTKEQACAFLKKITAPVLLIEAGNDKKDQWNELMQELIPNIKTIRHRIISGGHHLHLDNPEPVADVIREFLNDFSENS